MNATLFVSLVKVVAVITRCPNHEVFNCLAEGGGVKLEVYESDEEFCREARNADAVVVDGVNLTVDEVWLTAGWLPCVRVQGKKLLFVVLAGDGNYEQLQPLRGMGILVHPPHDPLDCLVEAILQHNSDLVPELWK